MLLLAGQGCAPRFAGHLTALCDGRSVEQRVTIVIDSVAPQAGAAMEAIRGQRADFRLTLMNLVGNGRCPDQSGEATWAGEMPAALEGATDADRRLEWRIEGNDVIVHFNPLVVDNNFGLSLPLRGGAGRWWLSTLAGEVAFGRAMPEGS